jgi:sodium-coupled neutral amino acid transporter 1
MGENPYVALGDYLPPVFAQLFGENTILANKFFTCGLVILLIEFPICLFRKLEFLGYASFIAIASVLYVVGLIIVLFMQKATSETGLRTDTFKYFSTDPVEVMMIIPTYFYAFGCHVTLLPMYKELKNRSVQKMNGLIISNSVIVILLYSVIAFLGYMTFAEKEKWPDNILLLLDPTKAYTIVAKILVGCLVIFSYPLLFFATRNSVEEVFFSKKKFSWIRWVLETSFLCALIYVTGMFVPDITTVFGIVGATAGVCVYYVFPLVIFIKIEKVLWKRIIGVVLTIIALGLGGVSLFAAIYRIVNRSTH